MMNQKQSNLMNIEIEKFQNNKVIDQVKTLGKN